MDNNILEFIKKAKVKHGEKYDYSKIIYNNSITKVIIICKEHGEFLQKPTYHLQKTNNCNKCYNLLRGKSQKFDTNIFIQKSKEIHGEKYDYTKINYINSSTKVIITCKVHVDFLQIPNDHLQYSGCSK